MNTEIVPHHARNFTCHNLIGMRNTKTWTQVWPDPLLPCVGVWIVRLVKFLLHQVVMPDSYHRDRRESHGQH